MALTVCVMAELLFCYTCFSSEGFSRYIIARILELRPCGQSEFRSPLSLKFCWNCLPIVAHSFQMETERFHDIALNFFKRFSSSHTSYVTIVRSSPIVASSPININYDSCHAANINIFSLIDIFLYII